MGTPTCNEHGEQAETFVCQHIVRTVQDGRPRGFFWSSDDASEYPDAWCSECNERLRVAGWQWTPDVISLASVQLLCAGCYARAKALNVA